MNLHRQRYVLLARDGVINRRVASGCVGDWEHFEFLPHALDALRLLAENDITTLVLTHQPGIAQGLACAHELEAVTHRFLLEVALAGGRIAKVYQCAHGDWDDCHCKSPRSGLVLRAKAENHFCPEDAYMVSEDGDDLKAAAALGCAGILLKRDSFLTILSEPESGFPVASGLYDAVARLILAGHPPGELALAGDVGKTLWISS